MKITDLNGKNICILGYGKEGRSTAEALLKYAPSCSITVADQNGELKIENGEFRTQLGANWLDNLDGFDVIIRSPGISPTLLTTNYKLLTSSTQIFLDTIADREAITIGVTGSKGKSTVSSLIYAILKEDGKDAILTGNIGDPSIAHLDDVKKGTMIVMEMSSYQLLDLQTSPHIGVVTSFFPEHLDFHGNLESYLEAKKNIARHQKPDDILFFNASMNGAIEIGKVGDARKIPFTTEDCPIDMSQTKLIGEHNRSNIAVACMVTSVLGVDAKTTTKAVISFEGLPHRLQLLGIHHGIEWVDDAISTTPESAIAALDALGDRVHTIILGGQDRGYDFTGLAQHITQSSVQSIILFPGSGPRIREALEKAKSTAFFFSADSMEAAVTAAKEHTPVDETKVAAGTEPIVLLSTASPSYGMFKNFEEKGDAFRKEVMAHPSTSSG